MSSATSIDGVGDDSLAAPHRRARERDAVKPWHFFVLASLLAATAAVVMARQSRPEHLVLISLTIGAAGFAAGALYRTLAPLVGPPGERAAGPLTESLRTVLEREKMLVLRSIKELEFDRAMRKLSARDFDEMAGRLRARAIALMRQLDDGSGYRELVEKELAARLASPAARSVEAAHPVDPADPVGGQAPGTACACGTRNDPDAAFCKRCGLRLSAS